MCSCRLPGVDILLFEPFREWEHNSSEEGLEKALGVSYILRAPGGTRFGLQLNRVRLG